MIKDFWPLLLLLGLATAADQEDGKILRPTDGAAFLPGEIRMIATASGGKLLLDGQPVPAEQPFPDVLLAKTTPSAGPHMLELIWQSGRRQIHFFVGDHPPEEFKPFRLHPPVAVQCTQCHGLSRKGRFRFTGGCFACHKQETFSKTHHHPSDLLEQCGQCHNAHGSTEKAHLIFPREKVCGLCHTVPEPFKTNADKVN